MKGSAGTAARLGLVIVGTSGLNFAAHAQQADQAPVASEQIQEIVVTSQKRSENVLQVPQSISVITGAVLNEHHVVDYQDIARTVPGVSFNVGSSVLGGTIGPGTTDIVIRGVSSQSGSATVSLYMDDVSLTESNIFNGAIEPKFLDFSRVEIERGPQGTLFGASAMGGMVRFISNQPVLDTTSTTIILDGSGTSHGGANTEESVIFNAPVIPGKLAIRLAAQVGYNSGYINQYQQVSTPQFPVNNFTQKGPLVSSGINWELWQVGRVTAKYEASDTLTITGAIFAQNDHSGDTPVFYSDSGTFATEKLVREPIQDRLAAPSVTIQDSFDDFDVTAVSTYLYRQFRFQTDGTVFNDVPFATAFVDGNLAGVPGFVPNIGADDTILAGTKDYVERKDDTYQWSQEVRATSKDASLFGHPLNWIVGAYFAWQRADRTDDQFSPGISQEFQNIYGFSINSPLSPVAPLYFPAFDNVSWNKDEIYWDRDWLDQTQIAGFVQADYNILEDLKVTAGVRYQYSNQSYTRDSGGIYNGGSATNPLQLNINNYAFTPKFSLTYNVTPLDTVYTTIAKGYRNGGPTGPASTGPCLALLASFGDVSTTGPIKFGPDTLWSYEVGTKNRMFDDRLSLDVDAFYLDWKNIQQSIPLGGACGENVVQNAGDARSYGGELEVTVRPGYGFEFGLKAGVTQATFTNTTPLLAGVVSVGEDVPNVPKYTITPSVDYSFDVAEGYTGLVHLDYTEVGPQHGTTLVSDPAYSQNAYGVMNAQISVDADAWNLQLYANNLLNNSQVIARPQINYNEEGYSLRPLTVGMRLRLDM